MKWAYGLWWDQWFPEVLKECRDGELTDCMYICILCYKTLCMCTVMVLAVDLEVPLYIYTLSAVADLNAGRQLMSVSHLKKQKSLAVKDDKLVSLL